MNASQKEGSSRWDTYQEVTDSIVAKLETGVAPWVQPWRNVGGMPRNGQTGHQYRGVNTLLLMASRMVAGYPDNRWVTFRQAELLGGHVRKGEKATRVIFWKTLDVTRTDKATGEKTEATVPMLRTYCVFNVAQCDGIGSATTTAAPATDQEGAWQASLDAIVDRIGVQVAVSDRACYVPAVDAVRMPAVDTFRSRADHAATFLHELVHASGAKHRLDRDLSGRFGSHAYAAEELVAELGSAFLCAILGIDGKLQHAEYVWSWIRLLHEDKRAIFKASSLAQAAADYLLATAPARTAEPVSEDA